MPDRLIGAKVGNYEVKQKLGEGGMGAVYLAVHPNIGKRVALKVLHSEFSSNEDVIGRFFTEAKAVNDIQHPNIVDIIDYGEMPSLGGGSQKVVYFIMEFLAGDSLAKVIHEQAPLAPERAQAIALQIADALGASHRHGIVHRDLKPDNVMITVRRDGRDFVKVLDFGIAKLTLEHPGSRRTRTGIVMGTPAYMSPEQCEGRGLVDHRTDIYALGILLYEMLAGQVPFRGEGYGEVLVQHMTQLPRKPSTVRGVIPPHLEAVCMKALEKRPADRFPDMDEFMRGLQDPVGYVEAHGGIEGFTTYSRYAVHEPGPVYIPIGGQSPVPGQMYAIGLGPIQQATTPATPYSRLGADAPHERMTTPMGGRAAVHLTPPPPQTGPGLRADAMPAFPTPLPIKARSGLGGSKIALVLASAVGLGVGVFFAYRALVGEGAAHGGRLVVVEPENTVPAPTAPAPTAPATAPASTAPPTAPAGGEGAVLPPSQVQPGSSPEASSVKIVVESTPRGAEVFVGAEVDARGKTPLPLELRRGDVPVEIVLKTPGYQDKRDAIVPSQDQVLDFVLVAAEKSETTAAASDAGSSERSDKRRRERDSHRRRAPIEKSDKTEKSEKSDKTEGDKGDKRTKLGDDILRPEL
ncbi:MAG TPA: serine/threonine-protein kinase [Candidatus Acidoferrum sp.]|nr:serine/threonine-protein kinase [Candidatus Acidoferrum sp.]